METGEFGDDVIGSNKKVAVLMTQDWCPQWTSMRTWVYSLEKDCDFYKLVYNRVEYFNEFRRFKEMKWGNGLIPYIRYYADGKLVRESNYVSKDQFEKIF